MNAAGVLGLGALGILAGLVVRAFVVKNRPPIPGALPSAPPYTGPLPKGITAEMYASAKKWAAKRGLPVPWVLTTIINESSANPRAIGDQGRSYGLMQVNHTAHMARLAKHGMVPDDLFIVDKNIMVGTEIMREFYDQIVKILAGRPAPADMGVLLRLYYRGPALVAKALRENPPRDPTPTFPQGPESAGKWASTLSKVSHIA